MTTWNSLDEAVKAISEFYGLRVEAKSTWKDISYEVMVFSPTGKRMFAILVSKFYDDNEWHNGGTSWCAEVP